MVFKPVLTIGMPIAKVGKAQRKVLTLLTLAQEILEITINKIDIQDKAFNIIKEKEYL